MKRSARLAQWTVIGTGILLLFWVAATVGGWSPDLRRLTSGVHGPRVADYRAESPRLIAPLSPAITKDASQDQATTGRSGPTPRPSASGGPSPSPSETGPTPTGSGVLPTLPVPTPTLPLPTPSVPVPTPTLPLATPTPPALNPPPTPTPPTPPSLF